MSAEHQLLKRLIDECDSLDIIGYPLDAARVFHELAEEARALLEGQAEPPSAEPSHNLVMGLRSVPRHDYCVLVGSDLTSDHSYQLKMGDSKLHLALRLTPDEHRVIHGAMRDLFGWTPELGRLLEAK